MAAGVSGLEPANLRACFGLLLLPSPGKCQIIIHFKSEIIADFTALCNHRFFKNFASGFSFSGNFALTLDLVDGLIPN